MNPLDASTSTQIAEKEKLEAYLLKNKYLLLLPESGVDIFTPPIMEKIKEVYNEMIAYNKIQLPKLDSSPAKDTSLSEANQLAVLKLKLPLVMPILKLVDP